MSKKAHRDNPPKWADRFLQLYCDIELIDEIQGDLHEAFFHRKEHVGLLKARWWFVWDVVRFFRPSSFKKLNNNPTNMTIYKNYLLTAIRSFRRDRIYASINLTGLIVGLTSCLLIALYLLDETKYDRFHPRSQDIYRVPMDMYREGTLRMQSAAAYAGLAGSLEANFAEVESSLTLCSFAKGVFEASDDSGRKVLLKQDKAIYSSSNFFSFFGFELLYGDPENVLKKRQSAVISENVALQYFGKVDVVGKILRRQGEQDFLITGVMRSTKKPSHIRSEIVLPIASFSNYEEALGDWSWYDFYTYVRLEENAAIDPFKAKVAAHLDSIKKETYSRYDIRQELWLQPVADIHLKSDLTWEVEENGDISNVYFLAITGLMILCIAWVNYINLSTARAVKRAKEVGVRKVLGSNRGQLIRQFLVEAGCYNFIAVLIALGLTLLLIEPVNEAINLQLNRAGLLQAEVLAGILVIALLGTLGAGLYPAFVLSAFRPINALKGGVKLKRTLLRKGLVVFQFAITLVLIVGILTAVRQLRFMQSQSLGMKVEETLVVNGATVGADYEDIIKRTKIFQNQLTALPFISGFATSNTVPGQENANFTGYKTKHTSNAFRSCYNLIVNDSYFDDFEIELVSGRSFNKDLAIDEKAVVLNESAVQLLGFESPETALGELLNPGLRNERRVIGVVKDFHQRSLKRKIDPIVFYFDAEGDEGTYYFLNLETSDLQSSLASIESAWEDVFPDNPLDYFFLDEFFDRQYQQDRQFNAVFSAFTGLAIFVACIGLFGLVSFNAEQRKKEFGIRKVMGASSGTILFLLGGHYLRLLLLTLLLATPIAFFLMKQWLERFAYQTPLGFDIFILATLVIAAIAFITVGWRSFYAVRRNPIESLREE